MGVSNRHFLEQGPGLVAIAKTALGALAQAVGLGGAADRVEIPGPEKTGVASAVSAELLSDYIAHLGGDSAAYSHTVPPHLFPQWAFPYAGQTLAGLGYPLLRVVNGGCRLRVNAPLPAGRPLHVSARLESADDDGRRVVLQQRITTGPEERKDAVVADLYAIVPLGGSAKARDSESPKPKAAKPTSKPRVPTDAREIAAWQLDADAGLDFARLTGDVNPIHWLAPYARLSGFPSVILHGFATMARTYEGLVRAEAGGRPEDLVELDVRFTRPLVLPARVGLYVSGQQVFVGDAPGGAAYLTGTFQVAASDAAARATGEE